MRRACGARAAGGGVSRVERMSDQGSSVTLVFYRMGERWWKEPVLNIAAAACQMSNLTHVEVAIGGAPQT